MKRTKKAKSTLPDLPALPPEIVSQAFPGGFTTRDEANALVAYAFRNGFLEELHQKITDDEMKRLIVESCEKLTQVLMMREKDCEAYLKLLQAYGWMYCQGWNR